MHRNFSKYEDALTQMTSNISGNNLLDYFHIDLKLFQRNFKLV